MGLAFRQILAAQDEWLIRARDAQLPPDGDWRVWLIMGGRGSGKTRAGAEWVSGMALGLPPFAGKPSGHIALVGETFNDAREVMVDGPSGILSVSRLVRPRYEASRRRLIWDNGAVATLFPRKTPTACAAPSSTRPGVMNWPNGKTRRRRGTCCNLVCGLATIRVRW